jgi:O-antigen ligase
MSIARPLRPSVTGHSVVTSRRFDYVFLFVMVMIHIIDATGIDYWGPTSEQALLYEPKWLGAEVRGLAIGLEVIYVGLNFSFIKRAFTDNWMLVAVVAFCWLSTAWSASVGRTIGTCARLSLLCVSVSVARARHGPESAASVMYPIVCIMILSQLLGLLDPKLTFMTGSHDGQFRGFFKHKNALGAFLSMSSALVVSGMMSRQFNVFSRATMALSLASAIVLVFLSHSATSLVIVALMIAAIPVHALYRRFASRTFTAVSLALGTVLGLAFGFAGGMDLVLGLIGRDSTFTDRSIIWNFVLRYIQQKPIQGWGFNALDLADLLNTDKRGGEVFVVASAHESYLEIALGIGAVGLLLYIIYVVNMIWRATASRNPDLPFVSVAIAYIFTGLTESAAGLSPDYCLIFFLLSCPAPIIQAVQLQRRKPIPRITYLAALETAI